MLDEAGVVDAGGAGFLLLLDALLHVVDGRPVPEPELVDAPRRWSRASTLGRGPTTTTTSSRPALRGHVLPRGARRGRSRPSRTCGPASATRSSSSAATASGTATSTPTTSAPPSRPAIEVGRPRKIRVTDLLEEVEEERWVREARDRRRRAAASDPVADGVVAVAPATASAASSTRSACRASCRRSVDEPVDRRSCSRRSSRCPADEVVILPNNKNIIPVAEQVDGQPSQDRARRAHRGRRRGVRRPAGLRPRGRAPTTTPPP